MVDRERVFELKRFSSPIELAAWLRDLQPELTAVDSPRAPAPFGESSRPDERELARAGICNIRWTPEEDALRANARYYGWVLHGFDLYSALHAAELTTVECFPTASWTRWGGRRGARRRSEWSQATLNTLDVELPARRLSQDDRDAIGAALTARAHADGLTESHGQIVVPAPPSVPVLLLTGAVGAGKSTIGSEAIYVLAEAEIRSAFVDLPSIGASLPPPPDDPHNERLIHRNLASLWANFAAAGATRLILARVLEARSLLSWIEQAVPGARTTVVRLDVPLPILENRIHARNPANPEWFLGATRRLVESMPGNQVEDHVVDNSSSTPREVAREVLRLIEWIE